MSTEPALERPADATNAPFEPVLRPRVVERLRHAARRRIALVVAPAGFGKSVAIRQYLETDGIEHLRFSVRKEHDSLVGFLRGLVIALEPIAPKASKSVAGAYEKASRGTTPVRDLASWVAALLSRYTGTVVVDDLHFAIGDQTNALLCEVIDRSPPSVSWIIAARTDFDLPTASWLAYGQREDVLGQEELRLNLEEAQLACESYNIQTNSEDLDRFLKITQGWPVAFSFAVRTSETTLIKAAIGSRETTYSYLADQVFKSLNEAQQDFLLKTCVLPRLDLSTISAMDPSFPLHIETLRNSGSFLLPDGTDSFRYHDLFRDFLEHLLRARGREAFHGALFKATETLISLGAYDHALTVYLSHRLTSRLDQLLEKHGWALLEAGALDRVTAALGLIDKKTFTRSPLLLSLQAKIDDGFGAYDSADMYFNRALTLSLGSDNFTLIAERWAVSLLNRFEIERADEVVKRVDLTQDVDLEASSRLLGLKSAIEARLGRKSEAETCLRDSLARIPSITEPSTLALCLHYAGYVSLWLGRTGEARDYCRKSVSISREVGLYDLAGRASSVLHELAALRDDEKELVYSLDEMTKYGRLSGDPGLRQFALFSDYNAAIERGDFARANLLEGQVRAEIPLDEERWAQTVIAADAMRLGCEGRFKEAYALEVFYRLERLPSEARALRAAEIALYASCSADGATAKFELEAAMSFLPSEVRLVGDVSARMAKAIVLTGIALTKQGFLDEARRTMRLINATIASRSSVGLLAGAARCCLALMRGEEDEVKLEVALSKLASSRLGGYAHLLKSIGVTPRFLSELDALTESEIKIVNLLRGGYSSKEIASKLGRSRLTVDTHVKAILRKLGCNSRREVVARLANR